MERPQQRRQRPTSTTDPFRQPTRAQWSARRVSTSLFSRATSEAFSDTSLAPWIRYPSSLVSNLRCTICLGVTAAVPIPHTRCTENHGQLTHVNRGDMKNPVPCSSDRPTFGAFEFDSPSLSIYQGLPKLIAATLFTTLLCSSDGYILFPSSSV